MQGLPGGSVVKNLPANAGDTGSIPGPRRSHTLQSKQVPYTTAIEPVLLSQEPQLLSPRAATTEAQAP